MKIRVILLVLAVSSLVLVSFMLPLALLLRSFAADRAVSAAQIQAQDMATLVATLSPADLGSAVAQVNAQNPSPRISVFFASGQRLGSPAPGSSGVQLAARTGGSFTERVPGGVAIFAAVLGLPQGPVVIRAFVPDTDLRSGVAKSWLILGCVAVGLLALSVIVAAQLSRSLVRPLRNVAAAAEQLASGDLSARAPDGGPPEIRQVSNGLNLLATRIGELLRHERETLADLSHRLRTPLTALRIDAESLRGDEEMMNRVVADVDVLTRTVNEIISQARRPSADTAGGLCDASTVVRERAAFWQALAEDQERWMTVEIPPHGLPVRLSAQDLATCVDILLENVFSHTPDGTAFSIRASLRAAGGAWLVVSDNGPGFSDPDPAMRGRSAGGSTGLGLDIARKIAASSGGTLTIGRSPHGGAAVTIGLGPALEPPLKARRHVRTRRALPQATVAQPESAREALEHLFD
jgi:signal transduction histidine kinase